MHYLALFSLIFLISCGDGVNITIPSFVVKPLGGTPVPSLSFQLEDFAAETISCDTEVQYYNDAPQLVNQNNSGDEYVHTFYAMANFYDCNLRQQAMEKGSIETDEDASVNTVKTIGDPSADSTRFVSWQGEADASSGKGKLVNLYLQDDGVRTKTRITFEKVSGVKKVNVLFKSSGGTYDQWSRAFFREVRDSSGDITGHYVGGRHYDSGSSAIAIVLAHLKKDVGISLRKYRCTGVAKANFNQVCNQNATAEYWDSTGSSDVTRDATWAAGKGLKTSLSDLSSDTAIESLAHFFTGSEADYFSPTFTP